MKTWKHEWSPEEWKQTLWRVVYKQRCCVQTKLSEESRGWGTTSPWPSWVRYFIFPEDHAWQAGAVGSLGPVLQMKELLPKITGSVSDAVRIWLQVCLTLVFTFSRNSSLTFSCKLKFEDLMYNLVTTVGNCTTELEFLVRVELKCFHTQKEDKYCEVMY